MNDSLRAASPAFLVGSDESVIYLGNRRPRTATQDLLSAHRDKLHTKAYKMASLRHMFAEAEADFVQ